MQFVEDKGANALTYGRQILSAASGIRQNNTKVDRRIAASVVGAESGPSCDPEQVMSTNPTIEGLGIFYLGRNYDAAQSKSTGTPLLYDAKDLVTHAVCVGMTGSGKTGLCIDLIEEAALDGIPSILIDPKGDLANLLLTFPDLAAKDFAPWVNADDAARKNLSVDDYAAQQADLWRSGLAKWGQGGERIARLRAAADFAIYTPGSSAGLPVSILKSFDAPPAALVNDAELFGERVQGTATSLLGLLGIDADPVQSREHILLSNLFDNAWRQGQNLDLATLVQRVQNPPFARVGALELEVFYPAKERFKLAIAINNLLASPSFAAWTDGAPLDIASFLHTPQGKPRVTIFSIAHLSDAERMFFVSLLLNQMIGWMRQQPGTTSLRALLYMDEIFGYFPPVANPPSKTPLLTLLKQARAFGVGIVLASQNPVDLDYKGLANTGTWFIGRLQTDRDKQRLLDGLEGAAANSSFDRASFNRTTMDTTLSGLGQRVFLMNNVHSSGPVLFESRWSMSYLRGPLTREQIKVLMDPVKGPASTPTQKPPAVSASVDKTVVGSAALRFTDTKNKIDQQTTVVIAAPLDGKTNNPDWDHASLAPDEALSGDPPAPTVLKSWQRDFTNWLANTQTLEVYRCDTLEMCSNAGESLRDFRSRIDGPLREERDRQVADLRNKYAPKVTALQDRLRRAQDMKQKQQEQSTSAKITTILQIGSSILGAFLSKSHNVSPTKIVTAGRAATRAYGESQDVGRADETVEAVQQQWNDLNAQLEGEIKALQDLHDPAKEQIATTTLRPNRTAVVVKAMMVRGN